MISSGGQCEEGVKMIIIIGEADIEEPTAEMSGSQTSGIYICTLHLGSRFSC